MNGSKLVLVVDDDDAMRSLLAYMVKQEGHRVETAADGEEAGRKAAALKPDLIVLDLMLPRYGGFELLRDFQKGELAKTPIFVVTGRYADSGTVASIRGEPNVKELREKPIKPDDFVAVLRRLLAPEEGE